MGKTRGVHETTPELRNRMVGMYEAGLGLREIAATVNCSQRTVKRWLNRFDKEGTVETRERCGRKRATTAEQDEAIVRLATQTPITAAKAVLPALGLTCSVDTIRERLHKAGIHNWSPPRKYMQRIPLGETDGTAIQQPVWRPTGTQLRKKKFSKESNKNERNISVGKKKNPQRKIRAKDMYAGDRVPTESAKSSSEQESFIYLQQNVPLSHTAEIQTLPQPLQPTQAQFGSTLTLPEEPQSSIYQHTTLNISQSWPLDLVQGSHHYPHGLPNPIPHNQTNLAHQLQNLHTHQEQQHCVQAQQGIGDQIQCLDRPQGHLRNEVQHQQCDHINPPLPSPQTSSNLTSDHSNTCASPDNNQSSSIESNQINKMSRNSNDKNDVQKKKKKGGKAKGTLETSVEIRNRMIGMSEAGLSTLSIALAIDRSERTVKRWLERWHKEGNVQTKERKGRRRITTKEQDEAIVAMATQQPLTAAKHVAPALGLKCSVDTIRERLHKAGIHSWKLGKKQGEGNAVHTVHLWQPSGNRQNKPKLSSEKRKIVNGNRKRDHALGSAQKRLSSRRKKVETAQQVKTFSPPGNMMSGQTVSLSHHDPPPAIIPPQSHTTVVSPETQQSMQQMGSMVQQRPDCRLAPAIVAPVSIPGSGAVSYPSCMVVATNTNIHTLNT